MLTSEKISRRAMLIKTGAGFSSMAALGTLDAPVAAATIFQSQKLKGRLKQSACRWCYRNIPLEELAKASPKSTA
jgi:hydroxypyruvate isomerase